MRFLRRYYILEFTFGMIALVALLLGIFGTPTFTTNAAIRPTPTLVSNETEIALAQEAAAAVPQAIEEVDNEDGEEEEFTHLAVAASFLNMDVDDLDVALWQGQTLAEIARAQGVDVQQLTDTLVVKELEHIDSLTTLDAEESVEWRHEVAIFTPYYVENGFVEAEIIAANLLGMEVDTFFELLEQGNTVAQLAQQNNVDLQIITDAIVAQENKLVDYLEAVEYLDAAEAGEWRAEIVVFADAFVQGSAENDN